MSAFPAWPLPQIESEKRRLETLRYLVSAPGYQTAASIIRRSLSARGVPTTADQMETCAAWLVEQELVVTSAMEGELILRITHNGREVAEGARIIPGVQRPDP